MHRYHHHRRQQQQQQQQLVVQQTVTEVSPVTQVTVTLCTRRLCLRYKLPDWCLQNISGTSKRDPWVSLGSRPTVLHTVHGGCSRQSLRCHQSLTWLWHCAHGDYGVIWQSACSRDNSLISRRISQDWDKCSNKCDHYRMSQLTMYCYLMLANYRLVVFYPNVTTLRSGLCSRNSVCRLSVYLSVCRL